MTESSHQGVQLICSSEVRFLFSLVPLFFPLSSARPHTHDVQDRTAADDIFSRRSECWQWRGKKTHLPVYLWCLFLGAGGQTGTEQAFANSRQTRMDHACPWLCPRIKKHVWPECSTAEAGKIMGWSQEKQPWLLDAEHGQGEEGWEHGGVSG